MFNYFLFYLVQKLFEVCANENKNEFFNLLQKIDEKLFQQTRLLPTKRLMKKIQENNVENFGVLNLQDCILATKNELDNANKLAKWGIFILLFNVLF